MIRKAVVVDGKVVNVIVVAADDFAIPDALLVASDTAGIGDLYDIETREFSPAPAPEPDVSDYTDAIERHLDEVAQQRNYSNADRIASYVNSTNPQWSTEAIAFVAWRDAVWTYAYDQLARVETGQREPPTVDEFVEELPDLQW